MELPRFHCANCDTTCSRPVEWLRHLCTRKHASREQESSAPRDGVPRDGVPLRCLCGQQYQTVAGLWKHQRKCLLQETEPAPEVAILQQLVLDVVKNHADLQRQFTAALTSLPPTSITNSHNKTFNLNVFLNEKCKDAMNLSDFVNSVTLQLSDLESVGKLGYVDGISNIIIKRLRDLAVHLRPIHCSDVKREIMHVKDNDKWEREGADFAKLRIAIQAITKKNRKLLLDWRDAYPESWNSNNAYNDHYIILINQAMGGKGSEAEREARVIKQLAREVAILK